MALQGITSNYNDLDLIPENIKKLVNIFGVIGTFSWLKPDRNPVYMDYVTTAVYQNTSGAYQVRWLGISQDATYFYITLNFKYVSSADFYSRWRINKSTGAVSTLNSGSNWDWPDSSASVSYNWLTYSPGVYFTDRTGLWGHTGIFVIVIRRS